jgi:hypothetical protein
MYSVSFATFDHIGVHVVPRNQDAFGVGPTPILMSALGGKLPLGFRE